MAADAEERVRVRDRMQASFSLISCLEMKIEGVQLFTNGGFAEQPALRNRNKPLGFEYRAFHWFRKIDHASATHPKHMEKRKDKKMRTERNEGKKDESMGQRKSAQH